MVSGRIESSAFSLSLGNSSFSLAFSLVLLPSFFLSLLLVLAFLPSFLPSLSCNTFVGQMHSEHNFRSAVTVRICMFVSSRKNLHTCKLPLAGSRSPLVKYACGSHIGFLSTSQTRSCALRMPRYVTFTDVKQLRMFQYFPLVLVSVGETYTTRMPRAFRPQKNIIFFITISKSILSSSLSNSKPSYMSNTS